MPRYHERDDERVEGVMVPNDGGMMLRHLIAWKENKAVSSSAWMSEYVRDRSKSHSRATEASSCMRVYIGYEK